MPDVITANLLGSGDVVYLGTDGRWVRDLRDAATAGDKAALTRLEDIANRCVANREVTAVYAFAVALHDGRPTATSVRERIRAQHGPTV